MAIPRPKPPAFAVVVVVPKDKPDTGLVVAPSDNDAVVLGAPKVKVLAVDWRVPNPGAEIKFLISKGYSPHKGFLQNYNISNELLRKGNSFNTRANRATRTRKQLVPRLFNSCHGFSTRAAT